MTEFGRKIRQIYQLSSSLKKLKCFLLQYAIPSVQIFIYFAYIDDADDVWTSLHALSHKKCVKAQPGSGERLSVDSSCLTLIHTGQPRVSAGSLPTHTRILAVVKAVMNAKYIQMLISLCRQRQIQYNETWLPAMPFTFAQVVFHNFLLKDKVSKW